MKIIFTNSISLLPFIILIKIIIQISSEKIEARITLSNTGEWTIYTSDFKEEYLYVATAYYENTLQSKGFDLLAISTNSKFSDEIQAEAAGYLEGVLTKDIIYNHYLNLKDYFDYNVEEQVKSFFETQESYLYNEYSKNKSDPVIYGAYLMRKQYQGIKDGYNSVAEIDKKLTNFQFDIMSSNTDIDDLIEKFNFVKKDYKKMNYSQFEQNFIERTHCSALFKIKNDFSDVYFGHNTWSPYNQLARIFKEYNFNFNSPFFSSKTIIFSSYPATLSSFDDFYITSNGLIIIETTNVFYDNNLYDEITPNGLLSWERAMTSCRLSKNAKEWAEYFSMYSTGTYNNQYMILDKNKINLKNKTISNDAFYIVEQLPGFMKINNVTDVFKFGYWSSYNTPFDKDIIAKSKIQETIQDDPTRAKLIDYDICYRAKQFRRDQSNVNSIDDMKKILRENNYKTDEFSELNPGYSISSRNDLNGKGCSGAYDAKVAALSELFENEIKIHIIGGPSSEGDVDVFQFSTSEACKNTPHYGVADKPTFDWFEYTNQFNLK